MLDDARIRRLIIQAFPAIDPSLFEVAEMDHGVAVGYWYRQPNGIPYHGRAVAINRTEAEIASDLAEDFGGKMAMRSVQAIEIPPVVIEEIPREASPYEGKRGKHPKNCTCSKHREP